MKLLRNGLRRCYFFALAIALSCAANAGTEEHFTCASMAPSLTESIFAIGGGDQLIAVCSQCDYPPEAKTRPTIGSFSSINRELLLRFHPNLVFLVDGQENIAAEIGRTGIGPRSSPVLLRNSNLSDISANVKTIGRLIGRSGKANDLAAGFQKQVESIRNTCAAVRKPRVLFCVWPQPLTVVGRDSYLDEVITACGGINATGNLESRYPHLSTEQILLNQPDVVILPHESEGSDILSRPPWNSLQAVANKRVYFLPPKADDRLSRPTLRLVEGMHWLAERLHPELRAKLERTGS